MSLESPYDDFIEAYAEVNLDALDHRPNDRTQVDRFAEAALATPGVVLDVGCGPGHVTSYLSRAGLDVIGHDISPAMIAFARNRFPDVQFEVADLGALPHRDGSVGGILSRYSVIHIDPASLPDIFKHWACLVEPAAPLTLAFFAADDPSHHGDPFDHKVTTAYRLCPETVTQQLEAVGFGEPIIVRRPFIEPERPINHATVHTRRTRSADT